ncbi:hypothetical protein FGO68_gene9671 [Halteria grandinella]|uniref:histone acetyltransferase n=1 Tax=Halteria grandinella TaxID=5974 RepID=A0A8J8T1D3_HALGN|nr:hypothetical protein FGO68_gene9671 [Halteria grandinella]
MEETKEGQDRPLFTIGDSILASLRKSDKDEYFPAKIIDEKKSDENFKYYVHYTDQDKRLDRWLDAASLKPLTTVKEVVATETSKQRTTRHTLRQLEALKPTNEQFDDTNPEIKALEKRHQEVTKVRNIESIQFGEKFEIDTWYFSPYPEEYGKQQKLYICEYCLKYMRKEKSFKQHIDPQSPLCCKYTRPPGKLIYFDKNSLEYSQEKRVLSIFEIDGEEHKLYCQNLCLLAKLFLDHKTLYYDVSPFIFYVITENNHLVGYFSKERHMLNDFNLACIMVLPPYQKRGFGKFLIALSYELSKRLGKVCTPEKPLSDMGKVGYKSYWTDTLLEALLAIKKGVAVKGGTIDKQSAWATCSVKDLSEITWIQEEDIIYTLTAMNLLRFWRGQHLLNTCQLSVKMIEDHFKRKEEIALSSKNQVRFKPQLLQ